MDGNDLRNRLSAGSVLMPGVWDALSARLASNAGFDVVFISGYATAGTQLGLPDFGYLTQTEIADVARRVCGAIPDTCVVVDGDTGYGNALNTIRTVQLYEAAGAAGIFLEDQVWPKRCGHMEGKRVVPVGEWLSKLEAALSTRKALFVVARTDARAAVDIDEACDRARQAAKLGVDAIFVEAPQGTDEMKAIADATPNTIRVANMVEGGKTPLLTPKELHRLGYDLVVSPLTGLLASTKALADAYGTLQAEGSLRDHLDTVAGFEEFGTLVDLERHYQLDARYRSE
ncbi:MAG TPA: isocitrate lyase/PEP mutase family protein [Acidimicrobiales bacterium]|nr:isocitrate lyase/PEP mutase family protein [Acidimicrobiales bacterium]